MNREMVRQQSSPVSTINNECFNVSQAHFGVVGRIASPPDPTVTSPRYARVDQLLQGLKLPAEGHQFGGLNQGSARRRSRCACRQPWPVRRHGQRYVGILEAGRGTFPRARRDCRRLAVTRRPDHLSSVRPLTPIDVLASNRDNTDVRTYMRQSASRSALAAPWQEKSDEPYH